MEVWKNSMAFALRVTNRCLFEGGAYSSSTAVQYKQPTFMATQCNKVGTERSISAA